ncbi:MAG: hypothetical protein ACW98Y_15615 [Candidatus Thorarchaeota archaeon]
MPDIELNTEELKCISRINLQLAIGIIGIIVSFAVSIMSTVTYFLMRNTHPTDWLHLQYYTQFLVLIMIAFGTVGVLGFMEKHEFKYLWIFPVILLVGLLWQTYRQYLLIWIISVYTYPTLYMFISQAYTVIPVVLYTICYLLIRNDVRNKPLLWALILGPILEIAFNQIWWFILYGSTDLGGAEWTVFIPYHIGILIVGIIFGILNILLYVDERKYAYSYLTESNRVESSLES